MAFNKMNISNRTRILAGRKAVDEYRDAHAKLHTSNISKELHTGHTQLLNQLIQKLETAGYSSRKPTFEQRKTEILGNLWAESYALSIENTGIYHNSIYKTREDITLIGQPKSYQGAEINTTADGISLQLEGIDVMNTTIEEHISMVHSVSECPDRARVFLAGLGLGLVLLYLRNSGKPVEIIICEKDERVIELIGQKVLDYFAPLPITIIHGDAFQAIKENGKFDWAFFDTGDKQQYGLTLDNVLNAGGIYTNWEEKRFKPEWE